MGDHHLRESPFEGHAFRLEPDRCIIQLYSLIGGIILFHYGPFLFFVYPEWYGIVSRSDITRSSAVFVCRQIYGGIAFAVAIVALISALALANVSASSICAFVKY